MEDLLTCRICYEHYKEGVRAPVLLPRCGHTFCRPCVAYLQNGCSVTCRVCSTEQRVDSAEALPTEFSLLAIIAARECQKAETCKIHEVKLSFWCRTCGEATCGECLFEDHPTHSHDVVRAQKYIQEMRIIARDIADKFMDALDSREQRFYNRVFKGARAISNALRSVNVLRKDMDEARTLMKGAREVENIIPAKELCDAAKYLGLKWSIQDVNLYPEKTEENKNKKENEEKAQEEVKEENKECENKSEEVKCEEVKSENEDENKNKEDIAEKENETKENGDPENKEGKSENNVENNECKEKTKEEKNKVKKSAQRKYSDSEDSEEETNRLKKVREEKDAKEAARMKRIAEKEAEEKLRENIMKQLKEERIKKEAEQRKKEEEEKRATIQERQLGRQARLRLKRAKTMALVGEQAEQPQGEPGKLETSASTANVPATKTTDDIPTDEQKKENEASVKKKKQEKNEIKSEEKEKEKESTKENNDTNNDNNETQNNEDQNKGNCSKSDAENTDTKEKKNKEQQDDEDKDLDESAENPMTEYEPDDKPGGNKIKIDLCQFPAFQIVVEGYGGRLAKMEWEDRGLHVYCHQFQELPYDVIIKSAVLYSLIPTKSPLVFMDINGGKHNLGRIYIRLWGHLRRAQNFLTLCLGDLGSCYMCTRLLETYNEECPGERIKGGDYEFNNGHGGKGVIQDLEQGTDYCMPMESGLISAGGAHGEQTESQFMICTEGNPESNFSCPFGLVVAGLHIIKQAVHRMTVQDVWIRDCGIVIETTNFQA